MSPCHLVPSTLVQPSAPSAIAYFHVVRSLASHLMMFIVDTFIGFGQWRWMRIKKTFKYVHLAYLSWHMTGFRAEYCNTDDSLLVNIISVRILAQFNDMFDRVFFQYVYKNTSSL